MSDTGEGHRQRQNGSGFTIKDLVSFAGLGATIFFGAMWLGSLSERVVELKATAISDGRIARLEQRLDTLDDNTKEIKQSIQELIREWRKKN